MKKSVLLITIVFLLSMIAGCGSKAAIPKGFKEINSQKQDGMTITQYSGSADADKAEKDFAEWAENEGWEKTEDSMKLSFPGYSGEVYTKKDEMLMIQIMEVGAQTMVTLITAPYDESVSKTTKYEAKSSKNEIAKDDVDGEDFEDVPRYPDSVRTDFGKQEGEFSFALNTYSVKADIEDVKEFYEDKLEKNGWENITFLQTSEDIQFNCDKEGTVLVLNVSDKDDYLELFIYITYTE